MNPPPTKKTIVWDLDDVLNPLMKAWLEGAWKVERPGCAVRFEDLVENPPEKVLGCTKAEYLESLDRFRLSNAAAEMLPDPRVFGWFESSGFGFDHHILTARPVRAVAPAAEWVFRHFGRWVRHFHFVPSPRDGEVLPAFEQTKADILAKIGPVLLFLDDSPENVASALALGIESVVVPQPWNGGRVALEEVLGALSVERAPQLRPTHQGQSK